MHQSLEVNAASFNGLTDEGNHPAYARKENFAFSYLPLIPQGTQDSDNTPTQQIILNLLLDV